MPITTLTWTGDVAYGPRGTRYELTDVAGLVEVRGYSPDRPGGWLISRGGTRESAMLAAQQDVGTLTEQIGVESDAVNGAGRTQLQRR